MVAESSNLTSDSSLIWSANMTIDHLYAVCESIQKVRSVDAVHDLRSHVRPSNFAIWTVGLISVTLISLCAAVGILFVKKLSKNTYNHFITIFVAVGVGSLITSSTLHLLPQSLGVVDGENHDFIIQMMFCIFGIYTFFFSDKLIKIVLESKKRSDIELTEFQKDGVIAINTVRSTDALIVNGNSKPGNDLSTQPKKATPPNKQNSICEATTSSYDMSKQAHGICVHDHDITFNDKKDSAIKTVAWMIIFGDGLHNFIDGVSIGAALSESILSGLSVSLAVFAEEFPHELGDVAILLHAGMNIKQALFYNLLSTISCFVGFVIGVLLGSVESFLRYIFGFSGGMFLYIALSCMMPEMKNTMEEALKNDYREAFKVLSLQTLGLTIGTLAMFFFARYGDLITLQ